MKRWIARLDNSRLLRYLLMFALGWVIAQLLSFFSSVLVIFIFAAILAFLLSYPVSWLNRFIPHPAAVSIVFLITFTLLAATLLGLGLTILSQTKELINNIPNQITWLISNFKQVEGFLIQQDITIDFNALEKQIRDQVLAGLGAVLVTVQHLLFNLLDLVAIAVVTFFMLLDGARPWQFLIKLLPGVMEEKLPSALRRNFLGFFWGRFLLSLFFGISVFVVLLILGAPYQLLLAAIAGGFDLIPGIGALIGISLVCIILLPSGIWLSIQVLVGCILLQQVEENVLMPKIMQGSVNLNSVILFLALLMGAKIAGLMGILLAIPLTGTLVSILELDELQSGH